MDKMIAVAAKCKKGLWLLALTVLTAQAAQAQDIDVQGAYIRETLPGTEISSAYMTIINNQDKPLRLVAAHSDISPRIEIHEHSMANGMMKMQQLDAIDIPAHQQVVLQPYGLHLMIFELAQPLKDGETVSLVLQFAQHDDVRVQVPVHSIKATKEHHH